MINIVSFNGGRGAKNLIPAFLNKSGVNLTSIVNAYDDGKSTGNVRRFFKMLGPSDIRKVQEAMVPECLPDFENILFLYGHRYDVGVSHDNTLEELFSYSQKNDVKLLGLDFQDKIIDQTLRTILGYFVKGVRLTEAAEGIKFNFDDCSITNLIYAGAFLHCKGNFELATILIDKLFKLRGTVLPTNNEDKKLLAIREDGTILYSEAEIVELRSNSRIKNIYLLDQYPDRNLIEKMPIDKVEEYFALMNRQVCITDNVQRSIKNADIIIYSAGTQHSSLYPSYITSGLADAIASNPSALKIFLTNIGEDYETPSYTAYDFIAGALKYLKKGASSKITTQSLIDVALVNNCFSNKELEKYVTFNTIELDSIGCKILIDSFEDKENPGKHDGKALSEFILAYYEGHKIEKMQKQ